MRSASLDGTVAVAATTAPEAVVPEWSPRLHRWFAFYLRRYFAKNFHAVRTSGPVPPRDRPLVVYTNHPSWWDPIHFTLMACFELPGLRIYGPMDAAALEKYRFFKKLGVFGVDPDTRRGAVDFLRTGRAVLGLPEGSLWLTAQGQFTDPRERPVRLKQGLAHLVRGVEGVRVVPLAVEYPFWNESGPEALSRFGEPIDVDRGASRDADEWNELFERRLESTMDELAADACSRDPRRFRTLVRGRVGVGAAYDSWRALVATLRGRSFTPAHDGEEAP